MAAVKLHPPPIVTVDRPTTRSKPIEVQDCCRRCSRVWTAEYFGVEMRTSEWRLKGTEVPRGSICSSGALQPAHLRWSVGIGRAAEVD
jgi:hypothetical protein